MFLSKAKMYILIAVHIIQINFFNSILEIIVSLWFDIASGINEKGGGTSVISEMITK